MPKRHSVRDIKVSNSGIHPNSRKAKQLKRILTHGEHKKLKFLDRFNSKCAPKLDKLLFFQNILQEQNIQEPISLQELHEMAELYLARHNEELAEIHALHSVRSNKPKASREAQLKMIVAKEDDEYAKGALEVPDLQIEQTVTRLLAWNGEYSSCNAITLCTISKNQLAQD